MLDVVVLGIAGQVVAVLAAVHAAGVGEGALQGGRGRLGVEVLAKADYFAAHCRGVGGTDGVGYVIVAAAHAGLSRRLV